MISSGYSRIGTMLRDKNFWAKGAYNRLKDRLLLGYCSTLEFEHCLSVFAGSVKIGLFWRHNFLANGASDECRGSRVCITTRMRIRICAKRKCRAESHEADEYEFFHEKPPIV